MKTRWMKNGVWFTSIVAVVYLVAAVLSWTSGGRVIAQGNGATRLNCDSQPCDAVARGRAAFNDRNLRELGGNGRACADCHMPSEAFQLSPAIARARFEALLSKLSDNKNADDPLFRPVDADDFRVNGDSARDFSNLVENGLVRVTMPLPVNVRLVDPATGLPSNETFVDLWRAVMPVLNVAITGPDGVLPIWPPGAPRVPIMGQDPNGPNRQGGYQHDGRFATLQEQARGALFAHAQVTVEPPSGMLDDLAAFQQTLFSSAGVERLSEAILSGSTFLDPDPELNELEQQGKIVFTRACAQCHGGAPHPSTSTPDATLVRPPVRYHTIQTACRMIPLLSGIAGAVPAATRTECADVPNHACEWDHPNRHHLGSGTIAPHRSARGSRRHGRHTTARYQQDGPVLPQQLRGDARGGTRPLRRLVQASSSSESTAESAADSVVERSRRRSRVRHSGRAPRVAGVPSKAVREDGSSARATRTDLSPLLR